MGIKSKLVKPFAKFIAARTKRDRRNAVSDQEKIRKQIVYSAVNTAFGKDHQFGRIKNASDFKTQIPIRDYEGLRPYMDEVLKGKKNILWPGQPIYLAKTSGTTSGVKYIPITKQSMPNHMNTARNALLNFAYQNKLINVLDGNLIFLSGSPTLENKNNLKIGRLSGIVNHEIPNWLQKNQVPSYATNCIEEWEEKLVAIVKETITQDLRLISGIPPWVQMYFEKILQVTGKNSVREVFPNFSIFAYGGVNYQPYKKSLEDLMGAAVPSFETYPASEGFIAFQDLGPDDGLLLNTNYGIYFEFIPLQEINNEHPSRLSLQEVTLDQDYVLIINSNAGLWGYNIGDTIRFVSKSPYRIVVSGRVKHFISAFGEHVIAKEVEEAMREVSQELNLSISEFTVAPQVNPKNEELPYHEWLVEFSQQPKEMDMLISKLDNAMRSQNIYYDDLRKGSVLQALKINSLDKGSFQNYMRSVGKLGGQNKVPRLANDRKIANKLIQLNIENL